MLDGVMARKLENIERADQIGADIGVRVFDRVPDPSLGGEMDDDVRRKLRPRFFERWPVLNRDPLETNPENSVRPEGA
jgi:hypothetical protein